MEIEEQYGFRLLPRDLETSRAEAPITPEAWKAEVRRVFTTVANSKVGGMLLREINRYGRVVAIIPYWWSEAGHPDWPKFSFKPETACRAKAIALPPTVWSASQGRPMFSFIEFSPERLGRGVCAAYHKAKGGILSADHEILFHEMVHSYRHVKSSGSLMDHADDEILSGGLKDYTNVEEFIAILVTNIYASANKQTTVLRSSHNGFKQLSPDLAGPFRFYQVSSKAFDIIERFCKSDPDLAMLLRTVKAPFNPIWAYFTDREKARRYSQSPLAAKRDGMGNTAALLERTFMVRRIELEKLMKRK